MMIHPMSKGVYPPRISKRGPAIQRPAATPVRFSGDGSFEYLLRLAAMWALGIGTVAGAGFYANKAFWQDRYEKNEPVCAEVIPDYKAFDRLVDAIGGRERLTCDEQGATIKK